VFSCVFVTCYLFYRTYNVLLRSMILHFCSAVMLCAFFHWNVTIRATVSLIKQLSVIVTLLFCVQMLCLLRNFFFPSGDRELRRAHDQ